MTTIPKRCKRESGQANYASTTKEIEIGHLLLLLPTDLIIAILIRLPIHSIFRCKCVCKTLKKILSDPNFEKVHLTKTPGNDFYVVIQNMLLSSDIVLAPMHDLDKSALFSKAIDHYGENYLSWQTLTSPALIPNIKDWDVMTNLIGSCNGLLFFQYIVHGMVIYSVCNPILGELTILPEKSPYACQQAAFGFCSKAKQYKVVRMFHKTGKCEILTLGTEKWRMICEPPIFPRLGISFESSYEGNLHWIVTSSRFRILICSFSLETELHSYISLPSYFNGDLSSKVSKIFVGTLDGLFCVSCLLRSGHFEAYVMEDYNVKESWIKKVSIDLVCHFELRSFSIFKFLNNGALVLRRVGSPVLYYDTRKETISDLDVLDIDHIYSACILVPSLFSLRNIVKREDVEEVDRKMLHVVPSKARVHNGKRISWWFN